VFKLPRGTRDFSPEEMDKRNYLEKSMRETFEIYGYKEVETPNIEYLELFTKKSGEGILNEIYSFMDKNGRELSLRPELTAPVIRFYINNMQMNPKPLKLYYFGKCYRYDRPQKGRYREFKQAGCELIGTDKPEALAELISLSYNILKNAGINDINLYIGNLKILSSIFNQLNLSDDQIKYIMPLIDKSLNNDLFEALNSFGINNSMIERFIKILNSNDINIIEKFIDNKDDIKNEFIQFKNTLELLKSSFKIEFNIKLGIVRGLDYYNGLVFEIESPNLGAEKQICGGGQYELIKIFKGNDTPTAGFALGFDRVIISLEIQEYKFSKKNLDFYIIPINKNMIKKSIDILNILRNNKYIADMDLLRRGVGKSLKYASSINALEVIIIGPEELEKDSIIVRNMETGEQNTIKIDNFIQAIQKKL